MSVYFISGTPGAGIKIGHARDVEARVKHHQQGNPARLVLLATLPGGQPEEAALHKCFYSLRIRGEWFAPEPELIEFIEIDASLLVSKEVLKWAATSAAKVISAKRDEELKSAAKRHYARGLEDAGFRGAKLEENQKKMQLRHSVLGEERATAEKLALHLTTFEQRLTFYEEPKHRRCALRADIGRLELTRLDAVSLSGAFEDRKTHA